VPRLNLHWHVDVFCSGPSSLRLTSLSRFLARGKRRFKSTASSPRARPVTSPFVHGVVAMLRFSAHRSWPRCARQARGRGHRGSWSGLAGGVFHERNTNRTFSRSPRRSRKGKINSVFVCCAPSSEETDERHDGLRHNRRKERGNAHLEPSIASAPPRLRCDEQLRRGLLGKAPTRRLRPRCPYARRWPWRVGIPWRTSPAARAFVLADDHRRPVIDARSLERLGHPEDLISLRLGRLDHAPTLRPHVDLSANIFAFQTCVAYWYLSLPVASCPR